MSTAEKLITIAENVPKVYEAGKKAEYDAFWDDLLYGKHNLVDLGNCNRMFAGLGWNDKSFDPPEITIKPLRADEMFRDTAFTIDMRTIKTKFDFSGCISMSHVFYNSNMSAVGVVDARKVSNIPNCFAYSKLETIEKLIVHDALLYSTPFAGVSKLKNITIEGNIGNSIDFKDCPLVHESIVSIVNALSSTVTGKTLTLSKTAVISAFGSVDSTEWQTLVTSKPNWTISLV